MADFGMTFTGGPLFVFSPPAGLASTLRITNTGSAPVYMGPLSSLLNPSSLPAGIPVGSSRYYSPVTVDMAAVVYATGPYGAAAAAGTVASASTAGSTSFTMAAAVPASLAAGSSFLLGNAASSRELLTVASTSASSVVTTTTGSLYDHAGSCTCSTVTFTPAQARVLTGVI